LFLLEPHGSKPSTLDDDNSSAPVNNIPFNDQKPVSSPDNRKKSDIKAHTEDKSAADNGITQPPKNVMIGNASKEMSDEINSDKDVVKEPFVFGIKSWLLGGNKTKGQSQPGNSLVNDDASRVPMSLAGLGVEAKELLTHQQQHLLLIMGNILRSGVPIIKHGRSGLPKPKVLFCDSTLSKLYWRQPGSKPDAEDTNLSQEEAASRILSTFRRGKRLSITGKLDSDRELLLRNVMEVVGVISFICICV
jgi:hypothetical protein